MIACHSIVTIERFWWSIVKRNCANARAHRMKYGKYHIYKLPWKCVHFPAASNLNLKQYLCVVNADL